MKALIQPEGLIHLGKVLVATIEPAAIVEADEMIETEAMLEAAEAVALSEGIKEEAALRAIAVLVAAEMIEEASTEEATDVGKTAMETK